MSEAEDATESTTEAKNTPTDAASRIRDLSAIDRTVASLLQSAGQAVQALTGTSTNLDDAKASFEQHTTAYFRDIQAVSARLRRQAYALEEAGIITAESGPAAALEQRQAVGAGAGARAPGAGAAQARREPEMAVTNGGLGNFDVGWLNSRRDEVGLGKEAELWAQARRLLEEHQREGDGGKETSNGDHEQMDESEG